MRGIHLFLPLVIALCASGGSYAQTAATKSIVIEQPWARATPKGAKTGAAYMAVINNGAVADHLVGAATAVADKVQFHQSTEDNGVSRMHEISRVDLAPGARVVFKPGEMHMMLVGLKQPLVQGQTFSVTLQFESAGNIEVTLPVEGVGAMHHGGTGSMMHMPNDEMKK